MVQQGLAAANRVFHIYNFVDPPRPQPPEQIAMLRNELNIPMDAWVLLTAGRPVPGKGHVHLLEDLPLLPAEIGGRPLYLVLFGDGILRPRLAAQAAQVGLN